MLAPPPVVWLLLIALVLSPSPNSGVTTVFLPRNKERRYFYRELELNCKVRSGQARKGLFVLI